MKLSASGEVSSIVLTVICETTETFIRKGVKNASVDVWYASTAGIIGQYGRGPDRATQRHPIINKPSVAAIVGSVTNLSC